MKTTTIEAQKSGLQKASMPIPAWVYLLSIQVLGLTVLSYGIREALLQGDRQWFSLLFLTAVASLLSTRISRSGTTSGSVTISLGDLFVFVTMLLLGPAAAALMGAVEGLVSSWRVKVKHLHKVVFNVAQLALTSFLIGVLVRSLQGTEPLRTENGLSLGLLGMVLVCGLIYFLFNSLLVATAMRLVSGQTLKELGNKGFVWALPTIGVNASLVVILLSLLGPIRLGLALALVPLVVVSYLLTGVKQGPGESSLFGMSFLPKALAQKAKSYLFGVVIVTIPVYLYCLHEAITIQDWTWLCLAGLAIVSSLFPIRLFSISDKIWLTVSDIFVFVALFQFGVEVAVVVASLEAIAFNIRVGAEPAYRWIFNLAQIILVAFLVGQFFALLQTALSRPGFLSIGNVLILLLAPWLVGFLYYALSSGLTGLAVAWCSNQSFSVVWVRNLRWCVVSVFGSMLAAMTFVIVNSFPW